jgi:RNA polymerase sigma-70 factor, ECF subfamily
MKSADVTTLLVAHRNGDAAALGEVWPLVYDHLRAIAGRQLRSRPAATLNATALVHEAYLRLVDERRVDWQNSAHFLAIAARCMRQILVDAARAHHAAKRGGGRRPETLNPDAIAVAAQAELIVAIDLAVESVAAFNDRMARIAECRLFAGLSEEETAAALGVSLRTVQREWRRARAWLRQQLPERASNGKFDLKPVDAGKAPAKT